MRRKTPPTLDAQIDDLLGAALAAGWDDPVGDAAKQVAAPEYPPLPVKDDAWGVSTTAMRQPEEKVKNQRATAMLEAVSKAPSKKASAATNEVRSHVSELMGLPANLTADQDTTLEEGDLPANKRMLNIGMLADIATGRQTPAEAAASAGVSMDELQAGLAVELGQMDPKDIAKAMGVQAAQEQLKAGALFGAVINDLVKDMIEGRLTPTLKLQLAEMLSVIGRVRPKEDKNMGAGGGFVLNISMGNVAPAPITIDAQD